MSELDRHIKGPDIGVMSSDLFIYDAKRPGTGGLVTVVFPAQLEERAVEFVKTQDLQITFCLARAANTARWRSPTRRTRHPWSCKLSS